MKNFIYLFILSLFIFDAKAQDSKFYIGVSAGYATPGGNSMEGIEPGIDLGFAHLGYRFTENLGVAANLNSSGHLLEDVDDLAFGVAYISAGPMFTVYLSDAMSLDIKPQAAFNMAGVFDGTYNDPFLDWNDLVFRGNGLVLGTSLCFGSGSGFGFSLNIDYLTGSWKEVEYDGQVMDYNDLLTDEEITQFKIGVGVRYNF